MTIFYYGCGLNISKQLPRSSSNEISILCCLLQLPSIQYTSKANGHPVQISFSHIFWKNGNDWELSGEKWKNSDDIFSSIKSSPLVRSSEKRIVYLKENGDVMVCTASTLKKLHLQYSEDQDTAEGCRGVRDIAVEDNCLLLVDSSGKLFNSGIEIVLPGIQVKEISIGKEHCLALTETGDVLSWGSGMKGQLGNGEVNKVEYPEKIVTLEGIQITSVCCGGWHSAALSASGDVYVWGWNDVGQLGFPSQSLRSNGVKWDDIFDTHSCKCQIAKGGTPVEGEGVVEGAASKAPKDSPSAEKSSAHPPDESTPMLNPKWAGELVNVQTSPKLLDFWSLEFPVKKIACGDRHTVFLLENGTAWTTGWNLYGQLGIGSNTSRDEPQLLPLRAVEDIFAGGWNSVLALSLPEVDR